MFTMKRVVHVIVYLSSCKKCHLIPTLALRYILYMIKHNKGDPDGTKVTSGPSNHSFSYPVSNNGTTATRSNKTITYTASFSTRVDCETLGNQTPIG